MSVGGWRFDPVFRLPGGWAFNGSLHPGWKDKDGCRWSIQIWHPHRTGFILSSRGIVR